MLTLTTQVPSVGPWQVPRRGTEGTELAHDTEAALHPSGREHSYEGSILGDMC